MSIRTQLLSALFTTLPALIWGTLIYLSADDAYFWKMYYIVAVAFLIFSFLIGFFLPALLPNRWLHRPRAWLFGQGITVWLIAVLILGLLTLTPLCVGQDNGDGNNDLGLCIAQTVLVSIVYSPLEVILLCLSIIPGGWFIKHISANKGVK